MTNMLGKMQDLRRRPYVEKTRGLGEKDARIQELRHIIEEQEKLTRELQDTLDMNENLNIMKDDMSGNLSSMKTEVSGSLNSMKAEVSGNLNSMKAEMSGSLNAAKGELLKKQDAAKEELSARLDIIKNELAEKVHTENVKCYRNVQSLIEELEQKLETTGRDSSLKSVKGYLKAAIVIGVLNLIAIAGLILYELDIFYYLPF